MRLSPEKRKKILNAAVEVFACNSYRNASTEEIASRAGISKGLLFYYFKNKQALYEACYTYVERMVMHELNMSKFDTVTDFFERMELCTRVKMTLAVRVPYLLEYALRVYSSEEGPAQRAVRKHLDKELAVGFGTYFSHVDLFKFKPEADPQKVLQMLSWITQGYLNEKLRQGGRLDMEEMLKEYRSWAQWFRALSYRKEYL